MHPSVVVVFAVAALVAPVARGGELGELTAAPASPYPIPVRLVVTEAALGERYVPGGGLGMAPPTLESRVVPVGRLALEAYTVATARMFQRTGEGTVAAELLPAVADSGVDLDRDGWFAYVEHDVVFREIAGAEIARWRVRGQGRIIGVGESAIPQAFAEATAVAARTFEVDFEQAPGVKQWLVANGIEPGSRMSVLPQLPRRFAPARQSVVATRTEQLLFAELGTSAVGAAGWVSAGFNARAGWSGRIWLLQLALDAWPREFVAQPSAAWGQARAHAWVLSAGLDAGVQRRLTSYLELAAGVGAALFSAPATAQYAPLSEPNGSVKASDTAFGAAASAFGAARLNGIVSSLGVRYRVGFELRKAFGTSLSYTAFGRTLEPAGFSAGVFVGFELPWRRPSSR
jgi:hypothetical protein